MLCRLSAVHGHSGVHHKNAFLLELKVFVKLKRIHGHLMEPGGSFWDLGAGAGKLVIAAAMMHNFEVRKSRALLKQGTTNTYHSLLDI